MTLHRHFEFACVKHGVFLTMPAKPEIPPICPHCEKERIDKTEKFLRERVTT
jgi:hypothetical protein